MIPTTICDSPLASALLARVQARLEKHGLRIAVAVGRGSNPALAADTIHTLLGLDGITLHAVGSDEDLPSPGPRLTVHSADDTADRRRILANLASSGGVDAVLVLPDAKSSEPDWTVLAENRTGTLAGLTVTLPEKLNRFLALADTIVHDELDVPAGVAVIDRLLPRLVALGMDTPRIAALAAVEVPNPGLPVTVWGDALAQEFAGRDDVHVQGPLSMDLAVSALAAEKKKAKGEVPGKADLLLAQSLTVARAVRDALAHGAGEPTATALIGLPLPVATPARGTGVLGAIASTLLTAVPEA